MSADAEAQAQQALRVKKLGQKKAWSERFAEWIASKADPVVAETLGECGTYLLFRYLLDGPEAGEFRLAATNYCGLTRLCPFCAHWRSVKVLKVYGPRIFEAILAGHIPVLMTFTIRNGPDLRERLTALRSALKLMLDRRRKARSGGHRHSSSFRLLAGMLAQIEIKLGAGSGEWHPHVHCLGLFEDMPDFAACRREWSDILGYEAQSDFKVLYSFAARREGSITREEFHSQLFKDLCEVVKYQCKFGDGQGGSLGFEETYEAFETVKPRERLLTSYGNLRGGEWDVEGDLVEASGDEWPCVEMLYRWEEGHYSLKGIDDGEFHGGKRQEASSGMLDNASGNGGIARWRNDQTQGRSRRNASGGRLPLFPNGKREPSPVE